MIQNITEIINNIAPKPKNIEYVGLIFNNEIIPDWRTFFICKTNHIFVCKKCGDIECSGHILFNCEGCIKCSSKILNSKNMNYFKKICATCGLIFPYLGTPIVIKIENDCEWYFCSEYCKILCLYQE